MSKMTIFKEDDIPFGVLQKFGLTREMVLDLPEGARLPLLSGNLTPVIPMRMKRKSGDDIMVYARMRLARTDNGVKVRFAPMKRTENFDDYSEEERERLQNGEVIKRIDNDEDEDATYHQFDYDINQVLSVNARLVDENINQLPIHEKQKDEIKSCSVIELQRNGNTVSLGIDLKTTFNLRFTNGGAEIWRRSNDNDLPKYSFGNFGCWESDGQGGIAYTAEDNYTGEMLTEFHRYAEERSRQMRI